ncbi:At1g47710 [Linum grandiflorum]
MLAELEQSSSPSKNAVLSPASIQAVLSLVAAGSKGATRDQLLSFLKANSSDQLNSLSSELVSVISDSKFSRLLSLVKAKPGPEISSANGVWVDKSVPLRHSFEQVLSRRLKPSMLNFQAHQQYCGRRPNTSSIEQQRGKQCLNFKLATTKSEKNHQLSEGIGSYPGLRLKATFFERKFSEQ